MKKYYLLSLIATIFIMGCSSTDDTTDNNDVNTTFSGVVSDGYIKNAKVCLDLNLNGSCDTNEPSTTTDINGKFNLDVTTADVNSTYFNIAPIISVGGINTITNETANTLIAPRYNITKDINITPITTLGYFMNSDYTNFTSTDYDNLKTDIKNLLSYDYDLNVFEDPQLDYNTLKGSVIINSIAEILMQEENFSLKDSYQSIIDNLENNTSIYAGRNILLNISLDLFVSNFGNIQKGLSNNDLEIAIVNAKNSILNNSKMSVPIGLAFSHNWYKLLQKYTGDMKYLKSQISINDNSINLKTTKIDNQQTRSTIFVYDFNNTSKISTTVIPTNISDNRKFVTSASTSRDFSTSNTLDNLHSNTNLLAYTAIVIKNDYIYCYAGMTDENGAYYEKDLGGENISDDLNNTALKISIEAISNDIVNLKVAYDNNDSILFSKDINITDEFNVTSGTLSFTYTKSRVQIDDDANDTETEVEANITNITIQ